ncbi:YidB family protein [Longispora sp. K20-0274]|uniref:YidB family protein n=1 Tax=Longispora sp. K20-0274 TaxID=3088255 RepID=UPI00399A67F0
MDLQQLLKNPMTQQIILALVTKLIGGKLGGAAATNGSAPAGAAPGGIDIGSILGGMLGGGGSGGGGIDLGKILGGVLGGGGSNSGLLGQLGAAGLGDQLQSWIGTGPNQPVDAAKLTEALGPDTVNDIAAQTGATPEQVTDTLQQAIPALVNEASPNGQLDPAALQSTLAKLLG